MATVICGSESRVSINVTKLDNAKLKDCEFSATFYADDKVNKTCVMNKAQMAQKDDDTFITVVDTGLVGTGVLKVEIEIYVPDTMCSDGNRKEIMRATTDINIIP